MGSVPESLDEVSRSQISTALAAMGDILRDDLLAVYLHGSAVGEGPRPHSDIDLLVILRQGLTRDARAGLLSSLLNLSGRYPARPGGPRCLEVMVFSGPHVASHPTHARAEFVYGEWLRQRFEAGDMSMPKEDPENSLVLAQARQEAVALLGPVAASVLLEVSAGAVRQAMRARLPSLLAGLQGDTRNVLLTLARMWRTASVGDFASKNRAALWAIPRMEPRDAALLDYARRAYQGETIDDWHDRFGQVRGVAGRLASRVWQAMSVRLQSGIPPV